MSLFFLPDHILILQSGKYGAVSYDTLSVWFSLQRFIESQSVPPDAQIIDYTWQFVNKSGGPDRRFSNNRQLPVMQYGSIQLSSKTGLNIHLDVSNIKAAEAFVAPFNASSPTSSQTNKQPRNPSIGDPEHRVDENLKSACEVLGVSPVASFEEITAAYHELAKMYHPDKLGNLAPEFIEIGEERMREINAAYQVIKQHKR
jgi:hypothetical protein